MEENIDEDVSNSDNITLINKCTSFSFWWDKNFNQWKNSFEISKYILTFTSDLMHDHLSSQDSFLFCSVYNSQMSHIIKHNHRRVCLCEQSETIGVCSYICILNKAFFLSFFYYSSVLIRYSIIKNDAVLVMVQLRTTVCMQF